MPRLTEQAGKWIGKQQRDKPFFLHFPMTSPHAPIVPAKEFVGKSKAGGYGDFMVQTNDAVDRVLKALKDGGFKNNTLVIFSSDIGPERYAYQRVKNFKHRSMGPLRGLKRDLWEDGNHVLCLVRWPGVVPADRVSEEIISQLDIDATLAVLVGAKVSANSGEDSVN